MVMKKFIMFLLISYIGGNIAYSQKEYRTIRSSLKTGSSLDQTLNQIEKYSKQDKFKDDPELYQYGVLVCKKLNDTENEKMYLKQKYDTAKFFSTIYKVYEYALKCDTKEQIPNSHGKIKFVYRNKNVELLKVYYNNLRKAGQYYIQKKKYEEAYKYFSMCMTAIESPMLKNVSYFQNSYIKARIAYWANICSYANKNSENFFKYDQVALLDTANRCQVMEMRANMYAQKGDTTSMIIVLQNGLKEYPSHEYFFSHLIDYYNAHSLYDKSLSLCNLILQNDSSSLLALYAKSVVLLNMQQYDSSISISQRILEKDSAYADAYYNIGVAYCNKAADKEKSMDIGLNYSTLKRQRSAINALYKEALPYMEKFRALSPKALDKWGIPLYRIYLHLNREKDFKKIDKLLNPDV